MFGKLHSIPYKPTRWELADIAPWAFEGNTQDADFAHAASLPLEQQQAAFEALLRATPEKGKLKKPEALQAAFDEKIDELNSAFDDVQSAALSHHQNKEAIPDALHEAHGLAYQEWARMNGFLNLLQNERYHNADIQTFCQSSSTIMEETFQRGHAVHQLLTAPPSPDQTASLSEPSEQQTPPPPSPEQLFIELNMGGLLEMNDQTRQKVVDMYNGKLERSQQFVENQGQSMTELYAQSSGLPLAFVQEYLERLPETGQAVAPIVPIKANTRGYIDWQTACATIFAAFDDFHPEMGQIARMAINDGWVNAAYDPQKTNQAFAAGSLKSYVNPSNHPYISLQYDGSFYDFSTLAHELGHAVAQYLEGDAQTLASGEHIRPWGQPAVELTGQNDHRFLQDAAQPNHTKSPLREKVLHETFAITAENLAINKLIDWEISPVNKIKFQLLASERISYTMSDSSLRFEHALYEKAQSQGELSGEDIADALRDVTQKNGSTDQALIFAARQHHIINGEPYYLLHYPIAEAGAQAILKEHASRPPEEQASYAQQWIDIMRAGSDYNFGKAMDEMGIAVNTVEEALEPVKEKQASLTPRGADKISQGLGFVAQIMGERAAGKLPIITR